MPDGDVQFAGFLAGTTAGTFCAVNCKAVERNFIENAVNSSQGTDIAAEGPVDDDCRKEGNKQDDKLKAENKTGRFPHGRVQQDQGNTAFKGSDRADPLSEPGLTKAGKICNKSRKQEDED